MSPPTAVTMTMYSAIRVQEFVSLMAPGAGPPLLVIQLVSCRTRRILFCLFVVVVVVLFFLSRKKEMKEEKINK